MACCCTTNSVTLLWFLCTFNVMKSFSQENHVLNAQEYQNCVCVPYWQCKDDYSGLVDTVDRELDNDIIDIIDTRIAQRSSTSEKTSFCTGDFDVCCKVECGKRRISSPVVSRIFQSEELFGFRILGEDNQAGFAEFPWMLGILKGRTYKCGASLIHPNVALTAAHCVSSTATHTVRAGEWNWELTTEPLPYQERLSKKVIIHPDFHPGTLKNDIALIILDAPFKLMENIGIACVPHEHSLINHNNCVATGWGKNSFKKGTYQTTLKKVDLPIVPLNKCLKELQNARLGPRFRLHSSFICAGGEAHKDTCKGDGGSPLMCPLIDRPDTYQQVGIVSWGLTCGLQSTPGVYVNVPKFSEWINEQLKLYNFDTTVYRVR